MIQQITIEMWDELSDEEKTYFCDCYEKDEDRILHYNQDITIGMLIEFLGDDMTGWNRRIDRHTEKIMHYEVWIGSRCFPKKELIHALWEAAKYKLRNK